MANSVGLKVYFGIRGPKFLLGPKFSPKLLIFTTPKMDSIAVKFSLIIILLNVSDDYVFRNEILKSKLQLV